MEIMTTEGCNKFRDNSCVRNCCNTRAEKAFKSGKDEFAREHENAWWWQGDGEDHLESMTCDVLINAQDLRNLTFTPEEAKELVYCWIHESQRRYGKVNKEAPLYLKLKAIAKPVLLKIRLQGNEVDSDIEL